MIVIPGSLEYFQAKLLSKEAFSFARYGDGEFSSILGLPGMNCDGVEYTSQLQVALLETLQYPHLNDNYYYGILKIAMKKLGQQIELFCRRNNLEIVWLESTFLVAANRNGKLADFLDVLRTRPIIYVAPRYLREATSRLKLPVRKFVEIPDKTAFEDRYRILERIYKECGQARFIGFSAGPATKWLIWSLFPDLGQTHTLFDFGSLFDGYSDRPSRLYQKRETWTEVMKLNLT